MFQTSHPNSGSNIERRSWELPANKNKQMKQLLTFFDPKNDNLVKAQAAKKIKRNTCDYCDDAYIIGTTRVGFRDLF